MTNAEAIRIINQYDCNFYWTDGEKIPTEDLIEAFELAVRVLDAQAPKLLDLFGQAVYMPLVWIEYRDHPPCPAKIGVFSKTGDLVEIEMFGQESRIYSASDYGEQWRCWSSCPTDEQRKVTPWME